MIQKVVEGKFIDPRMPGADITRHYRDVEEDINKAFMTLSDGL